MESSSGLPPRPRPGRLLSCQPAFICPRSCFAGCPDKLESGVTGASTPEASTPASLLSTPSGIRSPASNASPAGSPSPLRRTLQLAAGRLEALRSGSGHAASSGGSVRPARSAPPAVARTSSASATSVAAAGAGPAGVGARASHSAGAAAATSAAAAAADLLALGDQAELVGAEADVLREGLRGARRQLAALQRHLLAMQRQAARQQQLLGTVLMEQECEVKLARSEAEAYRTASRARTAAVGTLQR